MLDELKKQAQDATLQLLELALLEPHDIFVVGCSSSEITGEKIGTHSSVETACAVFEGIYSVLRERDIFLAAQCCEHLNRALILEAAAAKCYRLPRVNVVPQPKAGGSFATAAYAGLQSAVAVETLCAQAKAGIDIGGTLIGMHLAPVAVPVRLEIKKIGQASIICARTRLKFIGGARARYDEALL